MLKLIPFTYNNDPDELLSNTYVLVDSSFSCVVVDPSKNNENLKNFLAKNNYVLKAVLLTHGHFDHFQGAEILLKNTDIPLYIGFEDEEMLYDSRLNCSRYMSGEYVFPLKSQVKTYQNGVLNVLNEPIEVIPAAFHTAGSVCLYLKDNAQLITGDFLFKGGIGRSDLPNAAPKEFKNSINRVFSLPLETKIYPGHGGFSSLKEESDSNRFVY